MKSYRVNLLDRQNAQIFGEVNGFAHLVRQEGQEGYQLQIRFFREKKLIKIATNTPVFIPKGASEEVIVHRIEQRVESILKKELTV